MNEQEALAGQLTGGSAADVSEIDKQSLMSLVLRSVVGGVLMGLANLVPGISGGTMLLASGVYTFFIQGIAEITALRFRRRSLLVPAIVVMAAGLGILLLAGAVRDLVIYHRWMMYSLFIGLTLGGVPIVWQMAKPVDRRVIGGLVVGFVGMAVLAVSQMLGLGEGGAGTEQSASVMAWLMLLVAGLAGASAMILPGVSGGYLLLVLGQYVPILDGIDRFTKAGKARELGELLTVGLQVLLPVGIGVVIGVVVVSHLLKWCLARYRKQTLGVLLGLLFGAVAGLWPFRDLVPFDQVTEVRARQVVLVDRSQVSERYRDRIPRVKGEILIYKSSGKPVKGKDLPTSFGRPTVVELFSAGGLVVIGFVITAVVAMLGAGRQASTDDA